MTERRDAWSFYPGPELAVPVVLVGTITDIFLHLEATRAQHQLEAYEDKLHAILGQDLADLNRHLDDRAQADFAAIDADKLPKLDHSSLQSIGQLERVYSDVLIEELK